MATEGKLGERTVHVIIAALEFLPIIGQIVSIFEKMISIYSKEGKTEFTGFPIEIWMLINQDLDFRSLLSMSQVSKDLNVYIFQNSQYNRPILKTILINEAKAIANQDLDPNTQAKMLKVIGKAQAKINDLAGAKVTLVQANRAAVEIKDERDKSFRLAEITGAQAESLDTTGAMETIKVTGGERIPEWIKIGVAFAKSKNISQALEIHHRLDTGNSAKLLSKIAKILIEIQDYTGSLKVAELINNFEIKIKVKILSKIANNQFEKEDFKGASSTIALALEIADKRISHYQSGEKIESLILIAKIFAKMKDDLKYKELKNKALEIARDNSFFNYNTHYALVSKSLALLSLAKTFAQMNDDLLYKEIINEAKDIPNQITDRQNRIFALSRIAEVEIETKDFCGAEATLEEAKSICIQFPNINDRAVQLAGVAKIQYGINISKANETFEMAELLTEKLPTYGPFGLYDDTKDNSILNIILALLEVKDFDRAMKNFKRLNDRNKAKVINMISIAQARSKNFSGAIRSAKQIQDPYYKVKALTKIACFI